MDAKNANVEELVLWRVHIIVHTYFILFNSTYDPPGLMFPGSLQLFPILP